MLMLLFDILVSRKKLSSSQRYFQIYVGYVLWCNILIGIIKGFGWRSKVRIGAGLCRVGGGVEAISGLIDNPHHTLLVLLLLYILPFDIFHPSNSFSCCTRTEMAPSSPPCEENGEYAKPKLLGLSVISFCFSF